MDWALSAVAAVIQSKDRRVSNVRLVLGGVAPIPWRVPDAEAALKGKNADDPTLRSVAEIALREAKPLSHNGFKIPLTKTLIRRAVQAIA